MASPGETGTAFLRMRDTDLLTVAPEYPCFQMEYQSLRVALSPDPGAPAVAILVDVPGSLATVFPKQWFCKAFGTPPSTTLDLYFPDLQAGVLGAEVTIIDTPGIPIIGLGVLLCLCPAPLCFSPSGVMLPPRVSRPFSPPVLSLVRAPLYNTIVRSLPATQARARLAWEGQTVVVRVNGLHAMRLHVSRSVPCDVVLAVGSPTVGRALPFVGGLFSAGAGMLAKSEAAPAAACSSYVEDETGTAFPVQVLRCAAQTLATDRPDNAARVIPATAALVLGLTTKPPPASRLAECCGWISLDYLAKNDMCEVKPDGTIVTEIFGRRHLPVLSVRVDPVLVVETQTAAPGSVRDQRRSGTRRPTATMAVD